MQSAVERSQPYMSATSTAIDGAVQGRAEVPPLGEGGGWGWMGEVGTGGSYQPREVGVAELHVPE